MKTVILSIVIACLMVLSAYAQPMEIPDGSHCIGCGMKVDQKSPFSAQIIDKEGKLLGFCDIGDMLLYYRDLKDKQVKAYVRDYVSGEWLDALNAIYVKNDTFMSPMSWNIGAFKDKAQAEKSGSVMGMPDTMNSLNAPMKKKMKHMEH